MTLEILQKEMISAMKAHDKLKKETISSLSKVKIRNQKVRIEEKRK